MKIAVVALLILVGIPFGFVALYLLYGFLDAMYYLWKIRR